MIKLLVKYSFSCLLSSFSILSCFILYSGSLLAGTWSADYSISDLDSVHIYTPITNPTINNKRALMVSLHGCASSNTEMKFSGGWEEVADAKGMVVALPDVPGGGVYSDCWDYYGTNHTRANKFNDDLIALVYELMSRVDLNIDSNQVYITGFSSGGAQAIILGCLAPDIFSGVGSHSGPGLGTTSSQYGAVPWYYDTNQQANLCKTLSGINSNSFDTQLYSTIHGESDYTVGFEYNISGAEIMNHVYSTTIQSSTETIAIDGDEIIYSDQQGPRVSRIDVKGLGHAWSSSGGNFGYFSNTKVDYPKYVTNWFFTNNRRVTVEGVDEDGDGVLSIFDCDDTNNSIFPGADEVCDDGIDQDCNGEDFICSNNWSCKEYLAMNTSHYNANPSRVTYRWIGGNIYYFAIGSGQQLPYPGFYSYAILAEKSEGYFEVGTCSSD